MLTAISIPDYLLVEVTMKSYFLAPIESHNAAVAALNRVLPGQADPWILKNTDGDAMAYFTLVEDDNDIRSEAIQADVSGRHFTMDADVVSILETLRQNLGGTITNDS